MQRGQPRPPAPGLPDAPGARGSSPPPGGGGRLLPAEAAALPGDALAAAALALARRTAGGATLWCGAPAWPWHAHHLAVEFVHPVVVGARAVDAVAVDDARPVAHLRHAARDGDAVVLVAPPDDATALAVARRARLWGCTTLWLAVGGTPPDAVADQVVPVAADRSGAHTGVAVLAYHLLWELTQLCFEHPGLLTTSCPPPSAAGTTDRADGRGANRADRAADRGADRGADRCITCSDEGRLAEVVTVSATTALVRSAAGREHVDVSLVDPPRPGDLLLVHAGTALRTVAEGADPAGPGRPGSGRAADPTDFLYPFIDATERDEGPLLAALARSVDAKAATSAAVTAGALERQGPALQRCAEALSRRVAGGGRVLVMGNGGSATDAEAAARLLGEPLWGAAVPSRDLVADQAITTALANDIGFERVFARQVAAVGGPRDTLVGFSTSGDSANLLAAYAEARRIGMLRIGFSGHGGGRMAEAGLDHCFVVASDSVHRVQEAQSALWFALWSQLQQLQHVMAGTVAP